MTQSVKEARAGFTDRYDAVLCCVCCVPVLCLGTINTCRRTQTHTNHRKIKCIRQSHTHTHTHTPVAVGRTCATSKPSWRCVVLCSASRLFVDACYFMQCFCVCYALLCDASFLLRDHTKTRTSTHSGQTFVDTHIHNLAPPPPPPPPPSSTPQLAESRRKRGLAEATRLEQEVNACMSGSGK